MRKGLSADFFIDNWDDEEARVDLQEHNVVATPLEKVGNLSDLRLCAAVHKANLI